MGNSAKPHQTPAQKTAVGSPVYDVPSPNPVVHLYEEPVVTTPAAASLGDCRGPSLGDREEAAAIGIPIAAGVQIHDAKQASLLDEHDSMESDDRVWTFPTEWETKSKAHRRRNAEVRYDNSGLSKSLLKLPPATYKRMYDLHDMFNRYVAICVIPDKEIYDGDTAQCIMPAPFGKQLIKVTLRFYGYDSPERRISRALPAEKRAELKKQAMAARDGLCKFLEGKTLIIETMGFDNHSRILGEVYAFPIVIGQAPIRAAGDELSAFMFPDAHDMTSAASYRLLPEYSVSHFMVSHGYGYKYFGGKKKVADE